MSHSCDETYDVYEEHRRRCRKPRKCDACGETIERGHHYYRITAIFHGRVEDYARCVKCQTIHLHLRALGGREMWPAEQLDCGEEYEQHWGVPPPAEIARLAFMTANEAQRELVQHEPRTTT